jgi:hypothetical protein
MHCETKRRISNNTAMLNDLNLATASLRLASVSTSDLTTMLNDLNLASIEPQTSNEFLNDAAC